MIEQERENLEQMGFPRTKKAGDPNTICVGILQVSLDEFIKRSPHFAGDDELLDFQIKMTVVVGLDDSVNWAGYVLEK